MCCRCGSAVSYRAYDFGNVLRPVTFSDVNQNIPAVSGLLWTPVFVEFLDARRHARLLQPGQRRDRQFHADQVLLRQCRTSTTAIARAASRPASTRRCSTATTSTSAKIGTNWTCSARTTIPGSSASACGDRPASSSRQEHHRGRHRRLLPVRFTTCGLPASTRAFPNSSISIFYQFGANTSQTLPITQYYGGGITGFGLIGEPCPRFDGHGRRAVATEPEHFPATERADVPGLLSGAFVRFDLPAADGYLHPDAGRCRRHCRARWRRHCASPCSSRCVPTMWTAHAGQRMET